MRMTGSEATKAHIDFDDLRRKAITVSGKCRFNNRFFVEQASVSGHLTLIITVCFPANICTLNDLFQVLLSEIP